MTKEIKEQDDILIMNFFKWKIRDEILLIIIICLSISVISNWILTGYYVHKFNSAISKRHEGYYSFVPNTMDSISPMKSIFNRFNSIERDFIKPISTPHTASLDIELPGKPHTLPNDFSLPGCSKHFFEPIGNPSSQNNKIQTKVNFDDKSGKTHTSEDLLPPPPAN